MKNKFWLLAIIVMVLLILACNRKTASSGETAAMVETVETQTISAPGGGAGTYVTDNPGVNAVWKKKGGQIIQITPGVPHSATISAHEKIWYSVTVNSPANLEVYTESKIDTMIWIHSSEMEWIASDDDSGDGFNAHAAAYVPAGTYYIEINVFGEGGPYTLNVEVYLIPQH